MKILFSFCCLILSANSFSQTKKIELFDLVKKLVQDSTGYDTMGEWAVGKPAMYPIKWQADRVEMSDDMKINFFRKGAANISINPITYIAANIPVKWDVLLKGPRSGFTSFTISCSNSDAIKARVTIDSLFVKKTYTYQLLQDCSASASSGFYFYQVKLPKKVLAFIKISWACSAANCNISLECYDDWSKQYADLVCPK